jgi:hypothetical protein
MPERPRSSTRSRVAPSTSATSRSHRSRRSRGWRRRGTPVETGGNTFFCGATSNYGAYWSKKMDAMITANHDSAQPIAALKQWENHMAKEQIQIYLPVPAYRVVAYKKTLHGSRRSTPTSRSIRRTGTSPSDPGDRVHDRQRNGQVGTNAGKAGSAAVGRGRHRPRTRGAGGA